MTRLNKSVATTTGRQGVGGVGWMQEIPELMPPLCFILRPDVG